MKKLFTWIIPVIVLISYSCEDKYENVHTFSRPYAVYKSYPVNLDASEIIRDPQSLAVRQPDSTFKIVADLKYIYVGEKKKGVHVYSRIDSAHAQPLCFIECKEIKDFEVENEILYCNNFVDLLVIDIQNPLQPRILLREKDFFNKYKNSQLNFPRNYAGQYVIGYRNFVLTGTETHDQPIPGFEEYDRLYNNIIVKEMPDSILPLVGFARTKYDIYTYYSGNLASCRYNTVGGLSVIPHTDANLGYNFHRGLFYNNGVLFSACLGFYMVYACETDWINSSKSQYWGYSSNSMPLGFVYIEPNKIVYPATDNMLYFLVLYKDCNCSVLNSTSSLGAKSIIYTQNQIVTLGNSLIIYNEMPQGFITDKIYPDISGFCMLQERNTLIVSNKTGLFFYDISDLKKIIQIK